MNKKWTSFFSLMKKTYKMSDELSPDQTATAFQRSFRESMATEALATFTSGAFIIAFALHLGASNFIIGILAGIPPLMQLLQVPAVYIVEKVRRRRFLYAVSAFWGRLHWLVAAMIPIFMPNKTGLLLFIIGFVIRGVFLSVSNLSLISLLRDIVPQDKFGAFFSKRMRLASGVAIVLSLAAGSFIDWWAGIAPEREIYAYSLLFGLGFFFGLVAIYYVLGLPETAMVSPGTSILKSLLKPFQDKDFRNLMTFLGSWNFAINLAAPFFTVYMLTRLGLEMRIVIALSILSQLMSLLFMEKWGAFSDRFSNKAVLKTCAPIFLLCFVLWTLTTMPERHILTLPLLVLIHLLMGFSMAGTSMASGNIVLKLAPKGVATSYIAARTMINSIAAGFAPIIGGKFADFFTTRELSLSVTWKSPIKQMTVQLFNLSFWDFFFLLAFVLGYFSLFFLRKVNEKGEVEEGVILKELMVDMRRDLRNFSTIGGLRGMLHLPLLGLKTVKKSDNKKSTEDITENDED